MKIRKGLYLLLALVLPVGVFLFLKFFGRNQFDVAPLFHEKMAIDSDCSNEYTFPYVIPDSIAKSFQVTEKDQLTLIIFLHNNLIEDFRKQRNRISEELSNEPLVIRDVDSMNMNFSLLKKCVFLMPDKFNAVLIDSEKRIRGQYDVSSLEEMDRLIVEMKIILKRY
jgi:hypothetical protein